MALSLCVRDDRRGCREGSVSSFIDVMVTLFRNVARWLGDATAERHVDAGYPNNVRIVTKTYRTMHLPAKRTYFVSLC